MAFAAAGASNPVKTVDTGTTHRDWSCLVTGRSKILFEVLTPQITENNVLIYLTLDYWPSCQVEGLDIHRWYR